MAKGAEAGPKTGEFRLWAEARPEELEAVKDHKRLWLLTGMAHRVAVSVLDGRRYELVAQVGLWEPSAFAGQPGGEILQVDFTLVLLDPLAAEVGEWVKDLPERVPEKVGQCRLGQGFGEAAGRLFQRGRPGWQRIE